MNNNREPLSITWIANTFTWESTETNFASKLSSKVLLIKDWNKERFNFSYFASHSTAPLNV
jgi:hypothetical protein